MLVRNMAYASAISAPSNSVGPDYRPDTEKPTATISNQISYENVHILPQTPQLIALLTSVHPLYPITGGLISILTK